VLLIDEAQNLAVDALENLRSCRIWTATEKLLQIVLVGQPELGPLAQPALRSSAAVSVSVGWIA
jgi:type II secretory pathway predicted ATPase ExeA